MLRRDQGKIDEFRARALELRAIAEKMRSHNAKELLNAVADDYENMIRQQNRLLEALADQLNAGAGIVSSKGVGARLAEMAEFYQLMRSAMEDAIRRWKRGNR